MSPVSVKGNLMQLSAAARLQEVLDFPELPEPLHRIVEKESALEQPALAYLAAASGRSPLATALLAYDAQLQHADGSTQGYGNLLALRTPGSAPSLDALQFSMLASLQFYEADDTWLALARWPSGRTRLAIGGWGAAPFLAMDGRDPSGLMEAAENALMLASNGAAEDEARMHTLRQLASSIVLS